MAKAKEEDRCIEMVCPIGLFISRLQRASWATSQVTQHLSRSRIEFWKAIRSLIDERIEDLEKGGTPRGRKTSTRIKVE